MTKTSKSQNKKAPLSTGLRLIVALKMVQGALLAGVGIGLLMLHSQAANERVIQWLANWQFDSDTLLVRRLLRAVLQKLGSTDAHHFILLGLAAFLYALVTFTEGLGLWTQAFWAEYFTVGISASFLPLELLEIAHHPKIGTIVLLLINIAVVVYLVNGLIAKRRNHSSQTAAS